MKLPSNVNTYCRKCNKQTPHKVSIEKVRQRGGGMRKGTRRKQRSGDKGYGNKGRYSRKVVSQRNMTSKTTTKVDLRLKCDECGYTLVRSRPRCKRAEIVR
ncbi:MAG: 50S ribosomal protein L44e [Promethearchaeota archaeon]